MDFYNFSYRDDTVKDKMESIPDKMDFREIVDYNKSIPKKDLTKLKEEVLVAPWLGYHCISDGRYYNGPNYLISITNGTTGLASGNTMEEAIAQGLSEIYERYPYLRVVREKINPPSVNIDTVENKRIQGYIAALAEMNIEADIKDLTFGGKFPVMGVLFTNHNLDDCYNIYHKNYLWY